MKQIKTTDNNTTSFFSGARSRSTSPSSLMEIAGTRVHTDLDPWFGDTRLDSID